MPLIQVEQRSNYQLAQYHVERAKALWALVPEQLPDRISTADTYTQTLRAQSIDWHFKAADTFSRLAEIDESRRLSDGGVRVAGEHEGCGICGDPDDHDGRAHSEATGDGRSREESFGACAHSMVDPTCASCLYGHWRRTVGARYAQQSSGYSYPHSWIRGAQEQFPYEAAKD